MKRITREVSDRTALNASLRRLGIVELEERMEFSPLLVEGGLQDDAGEIPDACCLCKIPGGDPDFPDIGISNPINDGMGSTGPTDGGLVR